ncbi:MAG: hypothetical protein DK303_000485 [Chloroflexi bacterium]|jgi:hypothetical protein|nr:MAG: hypothetical protein DK303_000485 [Chloroflexota bacterium]
MIGINNSKARQGVSTQRLMYKEAYNALLIKYSTFHRCFVLGPQATSAYVDFFHLAINFNGGFVNIRTPCPSCSPFGMADFITCPYLNFTIWSFTCSHFSPFGNFITCMFMGR